LVNDLLRAAPDVILLVANTPEGLKVIQALSETPGQERVPVISHWGITGGNFFKHARRFLRQIDLNVVQTFSFVEPRFPDRARPVIDAYAKKYSSPRGAEDIFSPVGTAHAYDLVQILALAIEQAQSTDRRKVRDAMETLSRYEGLIRDYDPPFTPTRHDALDESNLFLASFSDSGILVPINYPSEVETTARHP